MRRAQKIMIGVFCAGVFLTGLGTGLTVSEASSFAYMGEKNVGPVEMKTETFECTFEPVEDEKFMIGGDYSVRMAEEGPIVDPQLPEHTIRFEVTYNAKAIRPYLDYEEEGYAVVRYQYIADEFGIFMECKDQILQEVKERKISSYRTTSMKSVKVYVDPGSVELVDFYR